MVLNSHSISSNRVKRYGIEVLSCFTACLEWYCIEFCLQIDFWWLCSGLESGCILWKKVRSERKEARHIKTRIIFHKLISFVQLSLYFENFTSLITESCGIDCSTWNKCTKWADWFYRKLHRNQLEFVWMGHFGFQIHFQVHPLKLFVGPKSLLDPALSSFKSSHPRVVSFRR